MMTTFAVSAPKAMNTPSTSQDPTRSLLCAVLEDEKLAVVRVVGRGNFGNSMALKNFAAKILARGEEFRLLVDMRYCDAMDSTFMGVLAGVAINIHRKSSAKLVIANISDHCRRLLKNLGLIGLLDIHNDFAGEMAQAEDSLTPATPVNASRIEQICLTLAAHQELVAIDGQNQIRFQAVIEYLEKSLQDEKKQDQ